MLKDITTIKLSGTIFDSPTRFRFFNSNRNNLIRASLLYGRNGTGKSTIAKAFRKIVKRGEDINAITTADFYDNNDHVVTLTEEENAHVFVFDEYFIDTNVKFQQENLEAIVMLGQVANLAEQIENAETKRTAAKLSYEAKLKECDEYDNPHNAQSPRYYIEGLKKALQGDHNWAGRDKEIKGNKVNTAVNDYTYKNFIHLIPSKSRDNLIIEFYERFKDFNTAKAGSSKIEVSVPYVPTSYIDYNDEKIVQILAEKIEKPALSDREQKLLLLMHDGKIESLSKRLSIFQNTETAECPCCFQPVSPAYKKSLVESIKKILSKTVENHQKLCEDTIIRTTLANILNLSPFEKISGYQNCINLILQIDTAIQENNTNLDNKSKNPYEQIFVNSSVAPIIEQLRIALANLEKERNLYNDTATDSKSIEADLIRINSEIAYYDTKLLSDKLNEKEEEYKIVKESCNKLRKEYLQWEEKLKELDAQKRNAYVALDVINAYLRYIFLEDDRLKIEYDGGKYKLLSHGKSIRPGDISSGERNIIALIYFFVSILTEKEAKTAYKEEYLLVIDDPISSYDMENRIGILSFLKYMLNMFLKENKNTKVLVMTHDLMAFYDLSKIFNEIIGMRKQRKNKKYRQGKKYYCLEIINKELTRIDLGNRQEYTEILKAIYEYAHGKNDKYDLVIGNMMRQVLEAFATFEYRKGISITTDSKILELIHEQKYSTYFKHALHSLILNSSSHKEDQIRTMHDFRFFGHITKTQKIRTAKDILCFIYLLNKAHLLSHLEGYKNVKVNIESWCNDIKKNSFD